MTAESHNLQTGKWSFNNHINISPNLELVSVHKSFDTIESSSIIKRFSFGELNGNSSYIYCCFSFRPKESTSRFFWVFNMIKQCFWYDVAYHFYQMRFTSTSSALKKCKLVLSYASTTLKTFVCFRFKEFIPSAISLSNNECANKLGSAKVLFIYFPSKSLLLGYSVSVVPPFSICLRKAWVLIKFLLNLKKFW